MSSAVNYFGDLAVMSYNYENAVFWDMMTKRGFYKYRSFEELYRLLIQSKKTLVSLQGYTLQRRRKRASCNVIFIVISMCYREDTADKQLLRRM
jgi:hypothetical protein